MCSVISIFSHQATFFDGSKLRNVGQHVHSKIVIWERRGNTSQTEMQVLGEDLCFDGVVALYCC